MLQVQASTSGVTVSPYVMPVYSGSQQFCNAGASHLPLMCNTQPTWSLGGACNMPIPSCGLPHLPQCSLHPGLPPGMTPSHHAPTLPPTALLPPMPHHPHHISSQHHPHHHNIPQQQFIPTPSPPQVLNTARLYLCGDCHSSD